MTHTTINSARFATLWTAFLIDRGFSFVTYYEDEDRDAITVEVTGSFNSSEMTNADDWMLLTAYNQLTERHMENLR